MRGKRFSIGLRATSAILAVTLLVTGTLHSTTVTGGVYGSNQNGPFVTFSPPRINFGDVPLGKSGNQKLTVTNTGDATLNIRSISTSANIVQTTTCGSSLAPGASCIVDLLWHPSHLGNMTGAIQFTDNAPGSPQTVPIKGRCTAVKLGSATLEFGNETVGQTSPPQGSGSDEP